MVLLFDDGGCPQRLMSTCSYWVGSVAAALIGIQGYAQEEAQVDVQVSIGALQAPLYGTADWGS